MAVKIAKFPEEWAAQPATVARPVIALDAKAKPKDRPQSRAEFRRAAERQRKQAMNRVRRVERTYARQLRKVARHVGDMINGYDHANITSVAKLTKQLDEYARILKPWAESVGGRMVAEVAHYDEVTWGELSREMSRQLRAEIKSAPTGRMMRDLLNEQVVYIQSLPIEAAQRVHKLTTEALLTGDRAASIAREIRRSGEVTASRATLIARTEVARTASTLVESRAKHVGSEAYIWRSSGDSDVRKEHRKLNGRIFRWNDPPVAGSSGMKYHAGQGPNCRCYPEPIIPD